MKKELIVKLLSSKVKERIEEYKKLYAIETTENRVYLSNMIRTYLRALEDCDVITYDESGNIMEYIGLFNRT